MANKISQETELYLGKQGHLFDNPKESTDLALMVDALAQEKRSPWDTGKIRDALILEAGVDPATAEEIAIEVEEELLKQGRTQVTTSIIRELVNVKLFQRGLDAKLADHNRIGIPVHDLEKMIFGREGFIETNVNISAHMPVNIFYEPCKLYEVKIDEGAVDIQINDGLRID